MKILLIVPRYTHTENVNYNYSFPLGLAYISATIKKAGYNLDCINLNHKKGNTKKIINQVLSNKKYIYVCLGGNSLIYKTILNILNIIKDHHTNPKTIIGGPIITSEPELMYKTLKPDYAIVGEGEISIIHLLKNLKSKKELNKINGIIFKDKNGTIKITPPREPIKNIKKIPYPDFDALEFREQIKHINSNDSYNVNSDDYPRTYPIMRSRGCPFACTFCWHSEKFRSRSIKDMMKEINYAVPKYNINILLILDDLFSLKPEIVGEFCDEIKKFSKKIKKEIKWTCQLMVRSVNDEILKKMRDSGCEAISYGFESYSPKILKSMRKPITPELINKAFNLTIKNNISVQANFIFGDVAETKKTAKETLDYWKNNCKGQVSLSFVRPYPGSQIYNHCLKKGIIKDKLDFIENVMPSLRHINMTDSLSNKEYEKLRKEIFKTFSKYTKFVIPYYIKNTKRKIFTIKVKCPYCEEKITYKNLLINNLYVFSFNICCRSCRMRFNVVSRIGKFVFSNYAIYNFMKDSSNNFVNFFKKLL